MPDSYWEDCNVDRIVGSSEAMESVVQAELRKRRGGHRNHKKADVDETVLMDIFDKHAAELMEVGPYEAISKSQAVNAAGIARNFELLRALLIASPKAEIPAGMAKHAIIKVLTMRPVLNKSIYTTSTFAGLRVDRISTMLYHVRRVKGDKLRQVACSAKCTGEEWKKVLELLSLTTENGDDDSTTQYVPEDPAPTEGQSLPRRKLQVQVSIDSEGFPRMFDSPGSIKQGKAKRASSSPNLSPAKKMSVDADGYPQLEKAVLSTPTSSLHQLVYQPVVAVKSKADAKLRPKAKAKAQATGKAKAKAKAKAKVGAAEVGNIRKDWGKMYYKHSGCFAIRRKWGKKEQIFQFKCNNANKLSASQHAALEVLSRKCILKLLEGCDEVQVSQWAQRQAQMI